MPKKLELKIVKLCDTRETREKGLMGFRKLKDDECAFFIFPTEAAHPFWNKNVEYSLSLACIDKNFNVECFMELQRGSEEPKYPEKRNIRYIVEVRDGLLEENGINRGDKVDFEADNGTLIIEGPQKTKFQRK